MGDGIERIPRIEGRRFQDGIIGFRKGRCDFCEPHGEHHFDLLGAAHLADSIEQFLDLHIAVGEDIALARPAALCGAQDARRHVAHVGKIIAALDARREFAVAEIQHELRQVAVPEIVRPEHARRMHDHAVEPALFDHLQKGGRRLCLRLGVLPLDEGGIEFLGFGNDLLPAFGDGVHARNIHEPRPHGKRLFGDIERAAHVDFLHFGIELRFDRDDGGAVDDDDFRPIGHGEDLGKRLLFRDVPFIEGTAQAVQGMQLIPGQHEGADVARFLLQKADDVVAQKTVGTGDDISLQEAHLLLLYLYRSSLRGQTHISSRLCVTWA